MRKFLISILLASVAAAPALAAQATGTNKNSNASQYQHRTQHSRQVSGTVKAQPRSKESRRATGSARTYTRSSNIPAARSAERVARSPSIEKRTRVERVQRSEIERRPEIVRRSQENIRRTAPTTLPKRPVVSTVPRPGTEPPLKSVARSRTHPHWNTNWRSNNRYDWHSWRTHHRSRYHLHAYIDPFGWGYYRYWIGWRLWPGFYASRYWINDPWYYRLPPAPPGTRWIRYYNDALLVDMYSGEVIDVIHDFFW